MLSIILIAIAFGILITIKLIEQKRFRQKEMIKITSVGKSFGEKKVFRKPHSEVKKEEIISLLGPNGCGKTTLLKHFSRFNRQDAGDIYIHDVLVSGKAGTGKVQF